MSCQGQRIVREQVGLEPGPLPLDAAFLAWLTWVSAVPVATGDGSSH